jgi:hypothetical protein
VSRLDAKIGDLKTAIAGQKQRRERLELLVPTFAEGGSVSGFGGKNFRNNPLGYQSGSGTGREDNMIGYFPSAGRYARFSNTEYILDADTTKTIGVHNLNRMIASRGQTYRELQRRAQTGLPGRADGGTVSVTSNQTASSNNSGGWNGVIEIHVTNQIGSEQFVEIAQTVVKNNDGSVSQFNAQAKAIQTQGSNEFLQQIANRVRDALR